MRNKVFALLFVGVFVLGVADNYVYAFNTTEDVVKNTIMATFVGCLAGYFFADDERCYVDDEDKIKVRSKKEIILKRLKSIAAGGGIAGAVAFAILHSRIPTGANMESLSTIVNRVIDEEKRSFGNSSLLDKGLLTLLLAQLFI